jgi:histidinol-phosphate/aromatic aminotransferase/cobyric acid decarboxylase-like protein
LKQAPASTLIWVDETYIEYAGPAATLEQFAVQTENVIICKSMSKVYALSGARVAYLCSPPHLLEALRPLTPPWSVSLPAQLAAITALQDDDYYHAKYQETHALRECLRADLSALGIKEIIAGMANFLLFYLPPDTLSAPDFIERCRARGLFLRDVSTMGNALGHGAVRVAVKDKEKNKKIIAIMRDVLLHATH